VLPVEESPRKATIFDIAREARVSTATVSRVLNKLDYPVREDLKRRVFKAAEKLDYQPNQFGRGLRGMVSKEIGVIVPSIGTPFYSQLVADVERHAVEAGYAPVIRSSYNSPQLEQSHVEMLRRQRVAGIILSTISQNITFIRNVDQPGTPCVLFDQISDQFTGSSVSFDFRKCGRIATMHLLANGHSRIAFASPPIDRASRSLLYEGYKDALRDSGIRLSKKRVFIAPEQTGSGEGMADYQCGQFLVRMLLDAPYLPDAVLAVNDIIAIGIMTSLMGRGVQIPSDISIMGFDDIAFASMMTPPLSTVRQSTARTAELAVRLLVDKIANPSLPPAKRVIEPEIVERGTVRKIHHKIRKMP
jgi:LacI family transcriptional regulator